jgi:ubiquinone/menaquinone biosynthesis C-methylase UbiE
MTPGIYDFPAYYDILFGWDRRDEASFYHNALILHGIAPGSAVVEICSGPGAISKLLAEEGWEITGIDANPAMVAYMTQYAPTCRSVLADMRDLPLVALAGTQAAFCPMSSIRLLGSDAD